MCTIFLALKNNLDAIEWLKSSKLSSLGLDYDFASIGRQDGKLLANLKNNWDERPKT